MSIYGEKGSCIHVQSFNKIEAKRLEYVTQNYLYFVHGQTKERQADSSIPLKTFVLGGGGMIINPLPDDKF